MEWKRKREGKRKERTRRTVRGQNERESSKCSRTNESARRSSETGIYTYSKHYGARSSFIIEIPSYFQSARVTWARNSPNPGFDAISLSPKNKCEKWDIFKKDRPDAFLDRSCFEKALFPHLWFTWEISFCIISEIIIKITDTEDIFQLRLRE